MNYFKYQVSKEEWEDNERERILNLFLEHEYGYRPKECSQKIEYKEVYSKVNEKVIIKKMAMFYDDLEMNFYIYLPNKKDNKNLKSFIQVIYPYVEEKGDIYNDYSLIKDYTPIERIVERNFALILLECKTIAFDQYNGEKSGIFTKIESSNDSSWAVLSSWAWGCSKVMDYIETDDTFDASRVAVIGHSRGGKTALLASAMDQRFYLTISNDSGNSGAALSRGNIGETIKDIVERFPYWFCKNYAKYKEKESDLPFDQHMLIGLIAPRFCYVASASLDEWADPEGELRSSRLASRFYEMYGLKGLIVPNKIQNDISYNEGCIAYHCRSGVHDLTPFDWECYMDYFIKVA